VRSLHRRQRLMGAAVMIEERVVEIEENRLDRHDGAVM
jgi:hypothetical protein